MTDDIMAKDLLLGKPVIFDSDILQFTIEKITEEKPLLFVDVNLYEQKYRRQFSVNKSKLNFEMPSQNSTMTNLVKKFKCFFTCNLLTEKPQDDYYIINNYFLRKKDLWSSMIINPYDNYLSLAYLISPIVSNINEHIYLDKIIFVIMRSLDDDIC